MDRVRLRVISLGFGWGSFAIAPDKQLKSFIRNGIWHTVITVWIRCTLDVYMTTSIVIG